MNLGTSALFVAAALCAAASAAVGGVTEDDLVSARGRAATRSEAVDEAIVSAVGQHEGAVVASTVRTSLKNARRTVVTAEGGRTVEDSLGGSLETEMRRNTSGRFLGYRIVAEEFDDVKAEYIVDVEVRFKGRYVVGRDPAALRRMAVANFAVRRPTFKWYGQTVDSAEWSAALANSLNVALVQTRRFTMLDRSFAREVDAELARIGSSDAAPGDAVRLGQKLGTDYLLVGEISFFDVKAPDVNPLTGRPLPRPTAQFAEIHYRVLLAPTGQLKWADTVRMDADGFQASNAGDFVSLTCEAAAAEVCDGIRSALLPPEIVAVESGTLVIGEGGSLLAEGDRFTVCVLGDVVSDTRTGETIDAVEIPVATAEIVSVRAKLSYARVIEGDVSRVTVGARLRRVSEPGPAPEPDPATTTIRSSGSGGVVTPF